MTSEELVNKMMSDNILGVIILLLEELTDLKLGTSKEIINYFDKNLDDKQRLRISLGIEARKFMQVILEGNVKTTK